MVTRALQEYIVWHLNLKNQWSCRYCKTYKEAVEYTRQIIQTPATNVMYYKIVITEKIDEYATDYMHQLADYRKLHGGN